MLTKAQKKQRGRIADAEAQLRAKQADYDAQLHVRQQLLRQITLLESVVKEDSPADLMQRLVLRALDAEAVHPVHTPPHTTTLQLEDLPLSLTAFDDTMLQRVAELTLEDSIRLHRSFNESTQCSVSHVRCHGRHSHMWQQLCDDVHRYSAFLMLHGFLLLAVTKRLLTLNLETLEEEEAPPGWYTRVARLIPVHADFAALVQAGVACVQSSVSREVDSSGDVLQQLRQLIQAQGHTEQTPFTNLVHLDSLLDQVDRCSSSVLLLRCMLSVYLLSGMLRFFDPEVTCSTVLACWPYAVRGMLIFEEYCQRADVQAVLQQDEEAVLVRCPDVGGE